MATTERELSVDSALKAMDQPCFQMVSLALTVQNTGTTGFCINFRFSVINGTNCIWLWSCLRSKKLPAYSMLSLATYSQLSVNGIIVGSVTLACNLSRKFLQYLTLFWYMEFGLFSSCSSTHFK